MVSNTDSDINKSLGEFKECLACDTSFKMEKQTLTDGIDDPEFLSYNFEVIECLLNGVQYKLKKCEIYIINITCSNYYIVNFFYIKWPIIVIP